MKFSELTKDLGINVRDDFDVKGVAIDSREIKPGYIFFALKGSKGDGADYVEAAVKSGARAVFAESPISLNNLSGQSVSIFGKDIRTKMNVIVEKFYTPMPKNFIAVTGTNGKTSIANFTASLIKMCGQDSASIGTLGTLLNGDYDNKFSESGLTSPDLVSLMRDLGGVKKKNIDYVAMETSSHGLHQNRIGNLKFNVAAFTNFTQDHMDYHINMDEYFAAKMMLFKKHIVDGGTAVLNADIPEYEKIKAICVEQKLKMISYGTKGAEIKMLATKPHDKGLDIDVEIKGKKKTISTSLIGSFQAYNVICAIGLMIGLGFDVDKVCEAANKLKPVKGRMDVIRFEKKNAKIVIDYAHTPDALEKAIDSLRIHTPGKLITLVGCGGDRDKTKRPLMGKIAAEKSDVVIVTDDNPRTENAALIRKDIMAEAKGAKEIAGRREAIEKGISLLESGDSLLLAGKGHEDYQIIGKDKLPFDEFAIVKEIIGNM